MWQDKLAQGFLTNRSRQVTLWRWYQKLGTSSFIGLVIIIAISSVRKVPAVAVILSEWQLAPANSPLESTLNKGTISHYLLGIESSQILSDLPNTLPSNYFSVNQSTGVNVPMGQHSEASILIAQLPSLPSTTLPPTIFPTNQTPSVSVPPLQPIPTSTPTPGTTSQSRENPPKSASPALSSPLVIEFGQPLPEATSEVSMPRRQRTIPSLEFDAVVEP